MTFPTSLLGQYLLTCQKLESHPSWGVLTAQVRLAYYASLLRLFLGLEGQTYHSGMYLPGDVCVSLIQPWTLVHFYLGVWDHN